MSNTAYPIGSIYRSHDLWESLPAEERAERGVWPLRFLIGCSQMLFVEIGAGLIGWLLRPSAESPRGRV